MIIKIIFSLLVASAAADDWYKTASFYQIYPQTFFDGGGGSRVGFGTFKGIEEKLNYIKSLGIDCIWLTPIFESSFNAFGYDITNYEKVDSRYGSEADFKRLVDAIHEKGMKIIVDFVPNHCGFEHEFFKKSTEGDEEFKNWFVWANGTETNPPSNWQRIGGPPGSAWNRQINGQNVLRSEFFYAQFYWNMPDFNLREPKVIEYWQNFLKKWLDFGLDGFRIDAISHGFEFVNVDETFPDEERNFGVSNPEDFGYLKHDYTQDQPELFELIYDWREIFDSYKESARIMMTESYSAPETIMKFYRSSDGKREGAHLPFNFEMIREIKKDSTAKDFVRVVSDWFAKLPEGETTNWAIGNHDQSRVASRFGTERVDIFNFLVTTLPGTSVTYYGEEIGMEDSCVIYNDDHNEPGRKCNVGETTGSDSRYRTPMQWDDTKNGGFSEAERPWLPSGDKYREVNVKAQEGKDGSRLEIYKNLQKFRHEHPAMKSSLSGFKIVELSENVFAFKREMANRKDESVLVMINFGSRAEEVQVQEKLTGLPDVVRVKIVGGSSKFKINDEIKIDEKINLGGYESILAVYNGATLRILSKFLLSFFGAFWFFKFLF